jgi:hypothetical protein
MRWTLLFISTVAWAGGFRWQEKDPSRLELLQDGSTVFIYNHGAGRQCCYLHPVYSASGVVVTDDAPADHPHHRGIFWAWPVVETAGIRGDLWMLRGARHQFERIVQQSAGQSKAELITEHSWILGDRPAVKESLALVVHAARSHSRTIDVELTLQAVGDPVSIAGAPEQNKGYGGLSARFAPRSTTVLRSDGGIVKADENHNPHAWAELEGAFDKGSAGLRITANAGNPAYPNQWCLRYYGFVGASFPGAAAYTLEPGKPVTLRYQVRVFDAPR